MARTISSRSRYTPRLELRPFRRRDLEAVLAAIDDSLPDLAKWLPWAHTGYGRSEAMRFLRDSGGAWAEGRAFDFAIRGRDDPDYHLGNISVWPTSQRDSHPAPPSPHGLMPAALASATRRNRPSASAVRPPPPEHDPYPPVCSAAFTLAPSVPTELSVIRGSQTEKVDPCPDSDATSILPL